MKSKFFLQDLWVLTESWLTIFLTFPILNIVSTYEY